MSALPLTAASAATITAIGGSADLQGYEHPLPALTAIGGWADLRYYAHPLPALTAIGGWADLRYYAHPLPALTTIGGSADLRYYAHPLPALTTIGESAYLRGYAHPLPALTTIGESAYLRGYAHATWSWLIYAGEDSRGYDFCAIRAPDGAWRIRAGCRDYSPAEALVHWGPGGESDRPDCLALVHYLIERLSVEARL